MSGSSSKFDQALRWQVSVTVKAIDVNAERAITAIHTHTYVSGLIRTCHSISEPLSML